MVSHHLSHGFIIFAPFLDIPISEDLPWWKNPARALGQQFKLVISKFHNNLAIWGFPNMGVPQKLDFFPPLTLMPCDSGRDNQLRVKSPPMIVIIN